MSQSLGFDSSIPITQSEIKTEAPGADRIQVERLYCDHYNSLKAFLLKRGSSEEIAEMLLQEVYLRLMSMEDLSGIHQPGGYLNRIAYHLFVDYKRRQQLEQKYLESGSQEFADESSVPTPIPAPFEQTYYDQVWAAYDNLLSKLPPPAREVLLLHKLDGLTHTQIAKKFGLSRRQVEKLIAKTLLHCREHGPGIDL